MALVSAAYTHAPVPTRVQEGADDAIVTSHERHRLAGKLACEVVAIAGQFRLVRQELPSLTENAFLLQLVDLWVNVHATRDVSFLFADQILKICVVSQ